ncbi:MAG: winged helix-turn-helix transcriptional regulator, partial [Bdellovibrionales bacterium]|nr:winged helix-turn-helix transcriptional regulator [Bdellovibrionales bacterium]
MAASILEFICDQAHMKIINAFLASEHPRYLRELVSICKLSPGGVSDIIKRLKSKNLLIETKKANRKYYQLNITSEEKKLLKKLFYFFTKSQLKKR